MKTDAELTLLAARACGLSNADLNFFDPLNDDGDALRVASRLKMQVNLEMVARRSVALAYTPAGLLEALAAEAHDYHGGDAARATRYAIVKAAAELTASQTLLSSPPGGG